MTQAEKNELLEEIDQAIDCIEQLDDHSPISADALRRIRSAILELPNEQ